MSLNQIKQLTSRIRTLALSDNVPRFEGTEILLAVNQLERLCEAPEPLVIRERADVGNLIEKLWPDAPQEIKSKLLGPINGTDWIGETVKEMEQIILRGKAEYQDRPFTYGNNPPKLGKSRRLRRQHRQ